MEERFRAFVAAPVGPLPGVTALLDGLHRLDADLKVVGAENLHLTLKFLGDTPKDRVPDVLDSMREAARDVPPVAARLEGVGAFGPRDAPRVVWVDMKDAEGLATVAARLDEGLAALGVAEREKRAFKAHVTLARSRSPRGGAEVAGFVRAHARADAGDLRVDEIRLMRSDLGPAGPRYGIVESVTLGGG